MSNFNTSNRFRAKKVILLDTDGHDPFIDYIKGIAIICVILTHCLPHQNKILFPFWGGQAVPIFLIIQSFHYFKKPQKVNIYKKYNRIIRPYIYAQIIGIVILTIISFVTSNSGTVSIGNLVRHGGIGFGNYYFWVYLQFSFIILPILGGGRIKKYIDKQKPIVAFIFLAVISELIELVYSCFSPSSYAERLLAGRYVFLVSFGYLWAREGSISLTWKAIVAAVFSFIAIYFFQYKQISLSPFVFDSAWRYFHWFCYFWCAWPLMFFIYFLYNKLKYTKSFIIKLGKNSYEIFLTQMLVFEFFPYMHNKLIYIITTTSISILLALSFNYCKNELQKGS